MSTYNASEVFQFAIRIEENGRIFYSKFADKAEDQDTRALFEFLAEEEVNHARVFRDLLKRFESYEPQEQYPEEYFEYLGAFADHILFGRDDFDAVMGTIDRAEEALQFAIQQELESILYYLELKKYVPEGEQNLIEKIVEQERSHFFKLTKLQKERQKRPARD